MLSFDPEMLYMPFMYENGIERGKDNTFIIYQLADGSRIEYSYNDIKTQSELLSAKLKLAGLRKGDRIAVVAVLRPMWYALSYTCLKDGYIMVCIDPGVPGNQKIDMMKETHVRAVFTSLNSITIPKELTGRIPVYAIAEEFPLLSECSSVSKYLDKPEPLPEDTFYVLFSSGTTSENRKAVLLRHSTVTTGIEYGMSTDGGVYKNTSAYTPRKCDLMLFPPYHIAGLLCATYDIYCNTKVIILERLTPNGLVSALQELKPDNICTVPAMLTTLYKKILAGFSSNIFAKTFVNTLIGISGFLRRNFGIKAGRVLLKFLNTKAFGGNMQGFMIGASPFDPIPNKFFLDMGIDVSMAYGLTELGAPLAVTGQGYYPGTTGRVIRHSDKMDIRIVNKDEAGRGEVEVLSPMRMISYMREEDNIGCFTEDGYFKTGDLGYFDKNDCLVICGRIKESIVLKNGEKLLPEEIENKYFDVDCVKELAVFKVPGEGGCDDFAIAIVKDKSKAIPDPAMITRVYERAESLPSMYRPKDVYVLKEFPYSSSHKVQRFRLTEMVIKGNSDPITDASMIAIDEDETVAALRRMLVEVGGAEWKTKELTQGLLLNIDSLSIVNLYVAIQEKWNIDLFQTSTQPETFGELLDTVKNFDTVEKTDKEELDLSKYPLPVSFAQRTTSHGLLGIIKRLWGVKAQGLENLPGENGYLLCSNHRTVIDPAFILVSMGNKIADKTCVIGKAELASDKTLSGFVNAQNYIPVDRTGNTIKTLERCEELLKENWNVLIFPEGTNVQNNTKLYPLKDGAAKLAIATGKPVVPVHLTGVGHFDGETRNFALPSLKGKITVKFGKPIDPKGMSVEELNALLAEKIQELD